MGEQLGCAFITGGAGGFGRAFAKMFLDEGRNVALADVDEAGLALARRALDTGQDRLTTHVCDARDRERLRAAALEARRRLGPLAVVCLNAGVVGAIGPAQSLSEADWRRVIDVNLLGPAAGAAVFLPLLGEQPQGGRIVFTASMAGMLGQPFGAPYSASKAGVVSLAESLAHETKGTKVKISVLCPGFANTPLAGSIAAPSGPGGAGADAQAALAKSIDLGLSAAAVALALQRGLNDGDFYIFTHADMRPWLERRMRRIAAAYAKVGA